MKFRKSKKYMAMEKFVGDVADELKRLAGTKIEVYIATNNGYSEIDNAGFRLEKDGHTGWSMIFFMGWHDEATLWDAHLACGDNLLSVEDAAKKVLAEIEDDFERKAKVHEEAERLNAMEVA